MIIEMDKSDTRRVWETMSDKRNTFCYWEVENGFPCAWDAHHESECMSFVQCVCNHDGTKKVPVKVPEDAAYEFALFTLDNGDFIINVVKIGDKIRVLVSRAMIALHEKMKSGLYRIDVQFEVLYAYNYPDVNDMEDISIGTPPEGLIEPIQAAVDMLDNMDSRKPCWYLDNPES